MATPIVIGRASGNPGRKCTSKIETERRVEELGEEFEGQIDDRAGCGDRAL